MEYMVHLNFNTPFGNKKLAVCCANITDLDEPLDIMTISAAYRSYLPKPETLLGALEKQNIPVMELAKSPLMDLRKIGNIWLSEKIDNPSLPITRLGCIESVSKQLKENDSKMPEEKMALSLKLYFQMLDMASLCGISVENIGMPILGGGLQKISTDVIISSLFEECIAFLGRNEYIKKMYIITNNASQAYKAAKYIENACGK